jgi:low affinity Fe/Cu permease
MNSALPAGTIPTGSTSATRSSELFRRFSGGTAAAMGSPWAFIVAVLSVVVWAFLGHHFKYSDTWQLVINTGTTIITFIMVFLIQNTQNRDARAIHLKLDELIRGSDSTRNQLINLENCSEEEVVRLEEEFKRLRERHVKRTQTQ